MTVFRLLSAVMLLLACGHAIAYQYVSYAPYPYAVPQNAYRPYARVPSYPYYPAYRYPVQRMPLPGYVQPRHGFTQKPRMGHVVDNNSKADAKNNTASEINKSRSINNSSIDTRAILSGNKQAFIETLLPYIEMENQRLLQLRRGLIEQYTRLDGSGIDPSEQQRLQKLAKVYRVSGDPLISKPARDELLRKIDIIPASLALAQAANESAWGKSRFAQEANNLFGIWTYDETKGLKPRNREQGKTHLVRIFENIGDSVRYYMYTLNSNPAYTELREIRWQLRDSGQVIDGHELAAGLEKYSAKGRKYIDLIQSLIRQNKWARLDTDRQQA